MKTSKTIITAIIILLAIPAMAQGNFNDRLFDAKVCEITNRLNLSAEQVKQFRPVYEKYNKAMISAWGNKEKPQKAATSEEVSAQLKQRMERQQRAQEIRIEYADKFAKVLTPEQLQKFYKVENSIQNKLRARKNKGKGKIPPRGRRTSKLH